MIPDYARGLEWILSRSVATCLCVHPSVFLCIGMLFWILLIQTAQAERQLRSLFLTETSCQRSKTPTVAWVILYFQIK